MDGDASPVAQQVAVSLVDDIDGSPAKETVQFNLDNRGPYEIDGSTQRTWDGES
jgi:hypothetical protein